MLHFSKVKGVQHEACYLRWGLTKFSPTETHTSMGYLNTSSTGGRFTNGPFSFFSFDFFGLLDFGLVLLFM